MYIKIRWHLKNKIIFCFCRAEGLIFEYITLFDTGENQQPSALERLEDRDLRCNCNTRAALSEYSGSKSVMSAVKCFIGVDADTKRHDCCEGELSTP